MGASTDWPDHYQRTGAFLYEVARHLAHPGAGDLVLKPTLLHGGASVLPGWHPGTSAQLWRDRLISAMGGPWVIQRRIRPAPEMCPGERDQLIPWTVTWGRIHQAGRLRRRLRPRFPR